VELRDLEYFQVIAEERHIGRAAAVLGLSQPALTKSVQRLEKELQSKLLERTPRGVTPTAVGIGLLGHVERIRQTIEQAAREAHDIATGLAGHVRLGTGPALADSLVPDVCRRLLATAPGVTLDVTVGMNDLLLERIEAGKLDLVIATLPGKRRDLLAYEPLAADVLGLFARKGHPLASRRLDLATLAKYPWALPPPTVMSRGVLEQIFAKAGISPPKPAFESNSVSLLLAMAAATDMLVYQPRRSVGGYAGRSRLVELDWRHNQQSRTLGLIYPATGYLPPAVLRLMEILRTVVPEAG